MSRFEFKLPDIGEGVMEGEVVSWLVSQGDDVAEDQPMVEVMTDKATVTITSPKAGKVLELRGAVGEVVPVHSVLVVLDLGGGGAADADAAADDAAAGGPSVDEPAATAVGDIRDQLPGMASSAAPAASAPAPAAAPAPPAPAAPARPSTGTASARPLATPATRRRARELGVDLTQVVPTGKNGRVVMADVEAHAQPSAAVSAPSATAPSAAPAVAAPSRAPIAVAADPREVRTPLRGMRRRIFDAMARSKHTAAHFTFVEECDVTALKALRERLKPRAAKQGVKLSYLPFFVKAVVAALKAHPTLNSAYDESTDEIVERRYYNIGIASATDAGLMVPVVHDADQKSLLEIAADIQRLSEATKSGRVAPEDLRGSTFTITSLGTQGGLFATPILNTPEVGILGIHRMKQRPVVRDGEIVIGDVMLLSLSFDHRLIDGHVGAAFAYEVIRYLEDPELFWLAL